MHARRIRGQHGCQHRRLRLVADDHARDSMPQPRGQNIEVQAAGEAVEDLIHVAQHERILLHVRPAHVLGQAGAGRLLMDEIVRRLRAVAHRQGAAFVQIGRRFIISISSAQRNSRSASARRRGLCACRVE